VAEGNLVQATFPRCHLDATACITGIPPGVFGPFLYGYRGQPEGDGPRRAARAANQLTITESDPVSKQPL
jgi:hypothetical protein